MESLPENPSQQLFDATPYLKLLIDKEGRWFQNGAEITHPQIYKQFNMMLEKKADGGYQVRLGREVCGVEVEDAPFVVLRVHEEEGAEISIELNDGSVEPFSPDAFWIGAENVPYIRVKNGTFHARFSRPAYYQIARFIVWDEGEQRYFLDMPGKRRPVRTEESLDES